MTALEKLFKELETPPHNFEAEHALIGAVMLNNDAFTKASQVVESEHFFSPAHMEIWLVMEALISKGRAATPITVKQYLSPEFEEMVGMKPMEYLARLAGDTAGLPANARYYAETVRDLHARREVINGCLKSMNLAVHAPVEATAETIFDELESTIARYRPVKVEAASEFERFGAISVDAVYEAHKHRGAALAGMSTGMPRLDDVVGGLQPSDLIIIGGRPAMGKAQPITSAIKTLDGWTTMGEVRLGQQLASPDGRPSVVTGIFPQGVKPIFEVTFSDDRKTQVCGEHLWRVRSRHWDAPRVLSTDHVRALLQRKRHQGRLSIDLVTGDFGCETDLPLQPWLLGMILGNGRLSGSVRLTTSDEENLARAERLLPPGMCITRNESGTHSLRQQGNWRCSGGVGGSPNPIAAYLCSAGLSGEGCHTMFVPTEFMLAGREPRTALLQGLMDSNGYVEKKGAARFVTSSPQLARDVQSLVRSLGGLCRVVMKRPTYSHKGNKLEGRPAYLCCIRHADASVLFANSKKREAATRGRNSSVRLTITSIEPVGTAEAQCIRVSHPDSLYVTDDYVVTHNTALGMGIGMAVARIYGATRGPVLISSLEMEKSQLKQRHLSGKAGVSSRKLRRGTASNDEMHAFADAEREEANLPVYIDHTGGLTLDKLAMRVRGFVRRHGSISLLVIDYLQLMQGSNKKKNDNRTAEITEITTGLKALAKELAIPIIALSQLSRQVENRDDKRPILADLRESGSIEQDADIVLFVYREEYYLAQAKPKDNPDAEGAWFNRMNRWRGIGEVICAKNRHDATGSVELGWDGAHSRFTNEPEHRAPDPDEARKNAKTVVLTSHGKAWKQILHDLSLSEGRRPTAEDLAHKNTLPANATLVKREAARALFYDNIVPDLDDKERRTKLQAAADNVRRADLSANFKDAAGEMWVYLPELIG